MILSYSTGTLGIDIFISLISIVITMTMSIVGGCPGQALRIIQYLLLIR